jgi:CheY-like chemotaxis protein
MPRPTVLVVDDHPDAANTCALLLKTVGYATLVATSGEDALTLASAAQPDVVLLDIGLPDISGIELCRRLRAAKLTKPLRIVTITGWTGPGVRSAALKAGADQHLLKPVPIEALRTAIGST